MVLVGRSQDKSTCFRHSFSGVVHPVLLFAFHTYSSCVIPVYHIISGIKTRGKTCADYWCIPRNASTEQSSFAVEGSTSVLPRGSISFAFFSSANMPQTILFVTAASRRGCESDPFPSCSTRMPRDLENSKLAQNVNVTWFRRSSTITWSFIYSGQFCALNEQIWC